MTNLRGIPLYNDLENFRMPVDASECTIYRTAYEKWGQCLFSILYVNEPEPYFVISKMGDGNYRSN